jgi:hypothetical protein
MRYGYYYLPSEDSRAFAAERIARAIVTHGVSYLSDSEIDALSGDPDFYKMVRALVFIIKREDFLSANPQSKQTTTDNLSLEDTERVLNFFDVWHTNEFSFTAEAWENPQTKQTLLEVKRWKKEDYLSPNFGVHDTIFWGIIEGTNETEVHNNIVSVLLKFEYTKTSALKKFIRELHNIR